MKSSNTFLNLAAAGALDAIFMQGQPADSLYFVLRGKVRLAVATPEGKEAIVATLGDGLRPAYVLQLQKKIRREGSIER